MSTYFKKLFFHTCRKLAFLGIAFLFSLCALPAQAQVGFSRACNLTELGPTNQAEYYAVTHQTVSGIPIHQQTADIKTRLWALESITTDYARFRYWLLAYSGQYKNGTLFRFFQSTWNSRSLYDNNRGLVTSVRAGHDFNFVSTDSPGMFEFIDPQAHQVIGVHYYYVPEEGRIVYLGITRASDCNCSQFGFEYDWANQFGSFFCSRF